MKNFTVSERASVNLRFTKSKSLFAAILFLCAIIFGAFPNQADAVIFGVKPNTSFNPAVPTIESFVEVLWIPAGTPKVLTMPGFTVLSAQSVTWNSDDLDYYIIITDSSFVRHLASVDPLTGICTEKGPIPGNMSTLVYNSDLSIMYGMSGTGGASPSTLYSLSVINGTATILAGPFSMGGFGNILAYNYDDMMIYHWQSGGMETIDPFTYARTTIVMSGAPVSEPQGAVYLGGSTFSLSDLVFPGGFNGFVVSSTGVASFATSLPYQVRGFGYQNSLLPVELSSFVAAVSGNNVILNWATATETNNSGFEIERSVPNGTWSKVGNVAGSGTTTSPESYSYTDRSLTAGTYSYRLKQIDFNGNFEYFNLTNDVNVGVPNNFNLSQNYPNPFNPSTSINFDLTVDSKVSLKIFDMSGKEVMTLVNEALVAGYHSVNFNASSLSSGVYFYNITAGSFTSTKKMTLIK